MSSVFSKKICNKNNDLQINYREVQMKVAQFWGRGLLKEVYPNKNSKKEVQPTHQIEIVHTIHQG